MFRIILIIALLTVSYPAIANERIEAVFCHTQEQMLKFLETVVSNPEDALASINAATDEKVCARLTLIINNPRIVKLWRHNDHMYAVMQTKAVAVIVGYLLYPTAPTIQFYSLTLPSEKTGRVVVTNYSGALIH